MTLYAAQTSRDKRLARAGSDLQAYACWMHGVEVCHSPYVLATGLIQIFPPLAEDALLRGQLSALRSPLWRSPGSVCGTAEALCCPQMRLPTKLGTTTIGTRSAWTCCWWRPTPPSLRRPTWSPRSSTRFNSDAQRVTLGSWVWESFSTNGAHGCVHGQPRDPATFCRAAPLPKGSQGALASLGTRRSSSTSGALRLAGEP